MPLDHTALVWTTVEKRGMEKGIATSDDVPSSPIHKPYYNNTKTFLFFVGEAR
jgi:hypothetical protein